MKPAILLSIMVAACAFDTSGVLGADQRVPVADVGGPGEETQDRDLYSALDKNAVDRKIPSDRGGAGDQRGPDQGPAPDIGMKSDSAPVSPIDAGALGQAFINTTVPCVDMQGNDNGTTIPMVDTANVAFFDGSVTLANAPAALVSWVGGKPSATVLWDPNGCDDESPSSTNTSWSQAGLLIRGASLNSAGQLVLQPGVTTADMNMLDIFDTGAYEAEYYGVDDSGLSSHPPLVGAVNKAKQLILTLAYP